MERLPLPIGGASYSGALCFLIEGGANSRGANSRWGCDGGVSSTRWGCGGLEGGAGSHWGRPGGGLLAITAGGFGSPGGFATAGGGEAG